MCYSLMDLYNGFARNYKNFSISNDSSKYYIAEKEVGFFKELGKLLGYSVNIKGLNKGKIDEFVKLEWKSYYEGTNISNKAELFLLKVEENFKDELGADEILKYMKSETGPKLNILMLDVISRERISYINKIIESNSQNCKKSILVIYKNKRIKEKRIDNYIYLFEDGILKIEKNASSYENLEGVQAFQFN